jgi:lipoprotein NlpD
MRFAIIFSCVFLASCASHPQAPVIDRAPGTSATTPAPTKKTDITPIVPVTKPGIPEKDWRPKVHIVKKGDTLHSIGLEYGHDYKEIAQKNNIPPPYVIHIGQQLQLPEAEIAGTPEEQGAADNGVVITPLKTDGGVVSPIPGAAPPKEAVATGGPPLITGPKALR